MADQDDMLDLGTPVPLARLADGAVTLGKLGDATVLLYRDGDVVHAFDAACTHLGAPLDDGRVEGASVRCPWHHACFDLRTGAACAAPAFDALPRYPVDIQDGMCMVSGRAEAAPAPGPAAANAAAGAPMVIIGGGAAGFAAADGLRKEGWTGEIILFSADRHAPYDRTLLTKDYLDGKFGDDRLAIAQTRLEDIGVHAQFGTSVAAIDVAAHIIHLDEDRRQPYAKLLLATGATPRGLEIPGADLPHVHVLRSLDDCRRILAALREGCRIVVVGGSFIGLEAAASLRSRGFDVAVVTPDAQPMAKVFGAALSQAIVDVHRAKGTTFHLGRDVAAIADDHVRLDDGTFVPADLVIVGIGVTPNVALAAAAGVAIEDGIRVDAYLRTSAQDVFAAGDIAQWPDPHSGARLRVEHWVVAERQGRTAAANMLGAQRPFRDVPFFWTKHFDLSVRYIGHAVDWDEIAIDGDIAERDALLRFRRAGHDLAVATLGRDRAAIDAERHFAQLILNAAG